MTRVYINDGELNDEEITIEPRDFTTINYLPNGGIEVRIEPNVAKLKNKTLKGNIGEYVAQVALEQIEGTVINKSKDKSFDLYASGHWLGRIEVKFSVPRQASENSKKKRFEFWLSSGCRRKDYTASCTYLVCVGVDECGSVSIFILPANCREVREVRKHLTVPVSPIEVMKSIYKKYNYPLDGRPFPEALRCAIEQVSTALLSSAQAL